MISPIWIDIIFAAVFLGSIIICAKRGALKAVSGLAGTILACIGGFKLQGLVLPLISKVLHKPVLNIVENAASSAGLDELLSSGAVDQAADKISQVLETLHLPDDVLADVAEKAQAGFDQVTDAIAGGIIEQIAPVIAFIVLFVVIKLAVNIICMLLSFDIPVISALNKTAGAVLGAVSGALIILVLCWGIASFAPEKGEVLLTQETFSQSIVGGAAMRIFK